MLFLPFVSAGFLRGFLRCFCGGFCGVSAEVSAGDSAAFLRGFLRGILPGSLRVLADWAVLFLPRFCGVSAGPFFGLGSIFGRAAKRTDAKFKSLWRKFVSAANCS